jgi:hypothetical protein
MLALKINSQYLVTGNNFGIFSSNDLLNNHEVFSIDMFNYVTSINSGTNMKIQFSQDNLNWYNSNGIQNEWESLTNGDYHVNLAYLKWQGPSFYYRINFSSNNMEVPVLKNINITYRVYKSTGTLESDTFHSDGKVIWKTLNWNGSKPKETDIKFQLKFADTLSNLSSKIFIGPDGTHLSYFTTSNVTIKFTNENDQWVQYKLYFSTSDYSKTPILYEINLLYNYLPGIPILTNPFNDDWINNSRPIFSWIFNDQDSKYQSGFQWQMDNEKDFNLVDYESGEILSNLTSYQPSFIIPNGIWYWRVRTQDYDGDWSQFSEPSKIKIDTAILKPENITVNPKNWSSTNSFIIDWTNPIDLSEIKTGAYYYIGDNPPNSQANATWSSKKPFTISNPIKGRSIVYLWLEDNAGNSNYTKYSYVNLKFDESPPKIEHNRIIEVNEGIKITIFANISDEESGVKEATLFFKRVKDKIYTELLMDYNGKNYSAIIPKDNVKPEGLEYYIKASDRSNPNNLIFYGNNGESRVKPNPETDIDIQVIRRKIKQQESDSIWLYIIGGIGTILLIIIIFIIIFSKGKKKKLPQQQHETQSQPILQQSPQKLCLTCGQSLTYYNQNNRYYCHYCKKYE